MRDLHLGPTFLFLALLGCSPDIPHDPTAAFAPAPPSPGVGLPDLTVDAHRLATSWVVYDQSFAAYDCSVQEGDVVPGDHRVLRFTVATPNIGDAALDVGDPLAHMQAGDGLFEFALCHNHLHYRNYATYELIDSASGTIHRAAKRGFCMLDNAPAAIPGAQAPGPWVYRSCGTLTEAGHQGISPGWADTYDKRLGGQYFVLDDPVTPVLPGAYLIRIHVNPPFACTAADSLRPRDAAGMCHNFAEADYDNNIAEVAITIPDRVGRTGFGPGGGAPAPTEEPVDGP